jgi:ankyrin repeat protein
MSTIIHEKILPSSLFKVDAHAKKNKYTFFPRNENRTKLAKACLYDDYKQVVYLVETEKVDVNGKADDGKTPLMYAIYNKNMEISQYLLDNGADKNITDDKGNSALNYAITLSPNIAMHLIVNGADIHIKNVCDESAIHFASMQGDLVIIQMLYERGADLNVFNYNKHSPLMMACGNKRLKTVKYLVKNGADINATDNNNDSILHGCIYNDLYEILLFLLNNKNNKKINERNHINETPLLYAFKLRKFKYAELLLKYGADPNVWDIEGNIPLLISSYLNNTEVSEVLFKYGANPNLYYTDFTYSSPLYYAIKNDNPKLIQMILNHNANDLMFCYIELNNYDNFEQLLDNVNLKNNNNETLLLFAARKNKLEFVKILLENGADPNFNIISNTNLSPLYYAVKNSNYEMVKLLIKYKANYDHRLCVYSGLLSIHGNSEYILGESILGTAKKLCNSNISNYLENLGAKLFYEWTI